jgi:serine/threonine protein phosphatase PrpC
MTRSGWTGLRNWWTGDGWSRAHIEAAVSERSVTREVVSPNSQLCAMSETGRGRAANEDAFRLSGDYRWWVIGDGMGGQRAGEIASRISVETVIDGLAAAHLCDDALQVIPEVYLRRVFFLANQRVLMRSMDDVSCKGMGSALVAAGVDKGSLHIGHAGDARAYLFRDGQLTMLTIDHSAITSAVLRGDLTWEAARSDPKRSALNQAVGIEGVFEPAFASFQLCPRDKVLLCSDGLWGELPHAEIAALLVSDLPVRQAARILVNRALAAGGRDDITLVLYEHSRELR